LYYHCQHRPGADVYFQKLEKGSKLKIYKECELVAQNILSLFKILLFEMLLTGK
jgi:hypothetical protein